MKLNMRINHTLSQGLDVFLFVTAAIADPPPLRHIREKRDKKSNWGQGQIGEKVKDSVGGGSKIERQTA